MTVEIKVSGMSCQHCVRAVTESLTSVSGVERVEVDLASGLATVEGSADAGALIAAVKEAGYEAEPAGS